MPVPRRDPAIVSRYLASRDELTGPDPRHHLATLLRRSRAPYLSVFGRLPWPGYREWLRRLNPTLVVPGGNAATDAGRHYP